MELLVEIAHALGYPDCLGASGDRSKVFDPGAPAGDLTNLAGSQRLTGVDTQGGYSQQRGESVDGRGTFGRHVRTGRDQNPQCSPDTVLASRPAQLLRLKGQDRGCDPAGIEGVRLAATATGPCIHGSRLHDLEAGALRCRSQMGSVGGDAFDDPQGGHLTFGVASGPSNSPVHARSGGRELLSGDRFASSSDQDGQGVSPGVGVHPDDERVGMRNDGHSGGLPSRGGTDPAANTAGAGLDGSHFGTAL
jgi:hypothetical protein